MRDATTLDEIRRVAKEHLGFSGPLSMEAPLVETLALDSLRMLTLVVELENAFQLNLEEGDEAGLVTVGDLVALLRRRQDARAG